MNLCLLVNQPRNASHFSQPLYFQPRNNVGLKDGFTDHEPWVFVLSNRSVEYFGLTYRRVK